MNATDHPLVEQYLEQFDALSSGIPAGRRRALRREIQEHLAEAIGSADSSGAALVILEFGTPEEIIEQELDSTSNPRRPRPRPRTSGRLLVLGAAGGVLVAVAVVLGGVFSHPPVAGDSTTPSIDESVVRAVPTDGPKRETGTRAYFEYKDTIKTLPSLPAGASWPTGVPAGLDAGGQPNGAVLQSGGGATVAQFTWLCAWEGEYLDATKHDAPNRVVIAEKSLKTWAASDFWKATDPDGGWQVNVLDPTEFGDVSSLKTDFVQSCAQAGIYNATY